MRSMKNPSGAGARSSVALSTLVACIVMAGLLAACSSGNGSGGSEAGVENTASPLPEVPSMVGDCEIGPDTQCPGAHLTGVDLSEIKVSTGGARARRRPADLQRANLQGADLTEANLSQVRLDGANLREATLRNAVMHSTSLFQADLRDADLTGADLTRADLEEALLEGAIFCNTTMPGGNLDTSGCR